MTKFLIQRLTLIWLACFVCSSLAATAVVADPPESNRRKVIETPGLVAFWDFVQREPDGEKRFVAHVAANSPTNYPLDAANYVKDYWGEGREATYNDFPLLGRGPFGEAIRIRNEKDASFRPFLFVPRSRLHDTPLDIKGDGKSVTVVVWAIRESGNHALAGIWHEGTDLKHAATTSKLKIERGQRQYALFAGLNKAGSACGHVSENGGSSFLNKYALHKCNSVVQSPEVPADSPADVLDASWQCFAMTFNHETDELTGGPFTIGRVIHSSRSVGFTGWIGGVAVFDRALDAVALKKNLALIGNAVPTDFSVLRFEMVDAQLATTAITSSPVR